MSKGAQPSESVVKIFRSAGLQDRYERFLAGEALETLISEAASAEQERSGSPKTRKD
jgi:small subunit ribosomal protein S16